MSLEQRHLHLLGALGPSRTVIEGDKTWLVVPTVALMEGVIHPVNAETPEFVSAAVLENAAASWNGKPVTIGHPTRGGKQCSADDDAIRATHHIGEIRNSRYADRKLLQEAWVDTARAEKLHPALLSHLRANNPQSVSVGAFVHVDKKPGTFRDKAYQASWVQTSGDHLAVLFGGRGACSQEMGCSTHRAAMHLVTAEGFEIQEEKRPMPKTLKDLKTRILALFDTPEQAVSEEVSELVKWQAMRATCDSLGKAWDEVDSLIDELLEAEAVHATDTGEEAETEIEAAKLDAIRLHLFSMSGAISALITTAYPMSQPVEAPRYMEQFKALYGKTISKATMGTVQKAHDASHDMHSHTVALGASCNGMHLLADGALKAAKGGPAICTACAGTGQIKTDDKQADCDVCDGTGNLKAAASAVGTAAAITPELKAAECGCKETTMTEQDIKTLEAENVTLKAAAAAQTAEVARLKALAECKTCEGKGKAFGKECPDCKGTGELKAAEIATALVASEAALRAAQAAQIPVEEVTKLRALAAKEAAQDAVEHAALVAQLTPLKTLTVEQLTSRSLEDLRTLAAFAKVETAVDYSGRGVAVPRQAETNASYTPPDPYEAGIKALQGAKVN